ncbi:MAG: hypothetical protein AB1492_00355 [Bacillota bacterium]
MKRGVARRKGGLGFAVLLFGGGVDLALVGLLLWRAGGLGVGITLVSAGVACLSFAAISLLTR